jgi:F5/8 type C domain
MRSHALAIFISFAILIGAGATSVGIYFILAHFLKPTPSTPSQVPTTYPRLSCYQNVALNKSATMSSTYDGSPVITMASNAVNGNTDGSSSSQISLSASESQPWWRVDLGNVYNVSLVDVWNRTDCCMNNLMNIKIMWSVDYKTWNYILVSDASASQTTYRIAQPMRYLRIALMGLAHSQLGLAEVQVWSCINS